MRDATTIQIAMNSAALTRLFQPFSQSLSRPMQPLPQITLGDIKHYRDAFVGFTNQLRVPQNIGVLWFKGWQEFVKPHADNEVEIA